MNWILLAYVLSAAALVYICVCGPSKFHRSGVVGWLYLVLINAPSWGTQAFFTLVCCSKQRGLQWSLRVEKYMCESRNPIMQVLYVLLIGGTIVVFFYYVYPMLPPSFHRSIAPYITIATLLCFVLACWSDPGTVTKENYGNHMACYDFDDMIFPVKPDCTTCELPKPARSKHCRVCKVCVGRYDHHCAWLNSDVGINNHRWFLLFLLSHAGLGYYGFCLCCWVMHRVVVEQHLWDVTFLLADGARIKPTYYIVFMYLLQEHTIIIGEMLFIITISTMLFGFFAYHAWLITCGKTTNETFKWSELRDQYQDEGRLEEFKQCVNKYNFGWKRNWKEVLFPPHHYTQPRSKKVAKKKKH